MGQGEMLPLAGVQLAQLAPIDRALSSAGPASYAGVMAGSSGDSAVGGGVSVNSRGPRPDGRKSAMIAESTSTPAATEIAGMAAST